MPYNDFNAWLEEPEPITWDWKDRHYSIPGAMSTRLAFKIQSNEKELQGDLGGVGLAMLKEAMGEDNYEALVDATNTDQFGQISEWAMNKLMGKAKEETEEAPKERARALSAAASLSPPTPSSPTGQPSSSTRPAIGLVPPETSETLLTDVS